MKISIIGAGSVGAALTCMLCEDDEVDAINLIDQNGNTLMDATEHIDCPKLRSHKVSIENQQDLAAILNDSNCVISALPYIHNYKLTKFAIEEGLNFIDLGGDDEMYYKQIDLAKEAERNNCWILPNAGHAPGLVNILAMDGFKDFDSVDDIIIKGDGLPINPEPPFFYQLAFSPVGLIKEYADDAVVIEDGELMKHPALTEVEDEKMTIMGKEQQLESFLIAGRVTSIAHLLEGKVKNLKYKTIRYPGHQNQIRTFADLGFLDDSIIDIRTNLTYRNLLIRQIKKHLPRGKADFLHVEVVVKGKKDKKKCTRTYTVEYVYQKGDGHSALVHVTALSTLITAKMVSRNHLNSAGGVSAPEGVLDSKAFIKELEENGLDIQINES